MKKKAHGECPECLQVYELTASGVVKGIGVLASVAFGIQFANPWIAFGLTVASALWGDRIEESLNAVCPECNVALIILGQAYGWQDLSVVGRRTIAAWL